ncbi:MAG TPA: SH3 domain-containing C40 family peptidase [Bacillota bacterium]|nr:SH3 domain-containing C40 family peptidase [Bacillota bacterium]
MRPTGKCYRWTLIFLLFLFGFVSIIYSESVTDISFIAASAVNLRSEPSTSSPIITVLKRGQPCEIINQQDEWVYIKLPNELTGWVSVQYISFSPLSPSEHLMSPLHEELIRFAHSLLNTKYRYGGNSPSGFDCSGFTRYVYAQFGYELPHKASEQMKYGQPIEKDSLQKGDLVFFKTLGSKIINHVGIYTENGNFIHASSGAGRVTISPLTSGYYLPRYQGARRILSTINK